MQNIKNQINWVNTLFLIVTPIIGVVGTVLFVVFGLASWQNWALFGGMLFATGLSVTAGYHRLFAHKTYEANWFVQLFFVLFGAAAFEGSVWEWSTDHRDHHRYTDTEKDPYNIQEGFWHAHMGWLIRLDPKKRTFENISELKQSKLFKFQHQWFEAIAVLVGLGLPTAIASLWGEPLAGLIIAGFLRIAVLHHGTFCINSLCHILGKRPYSKKQSARDSWVSAIFTFGEGYHNFHHQFPLDYRNGIRFWQYDPTKWLIKGMSYVGLASDLKKIPEARILQACIEAQGKEVTMGEGLVSQLYQDLLAKVNELKALEKAYAESKLKEYRIKIKHLRAQVSAMFEGWKRLAHLPEQSVV